MKETLASFELAPDKRNFPLLLYALTCLVAKASTTARAHLIQNASRELVELGSWGLFLGGAQQGTDPTVIVLVLTLGEIGG